MNGRMHLLSYPLTVFSHYFAHPSIQTLNGGGSTSMKNHPTTNMPPQSPGCFGVAFLQHRLSVSRVPYPRHHLIPRLKFRLVTMKSNEFMQRYQHWYILEGQTVPICIEPLSRVQMKGSGQNSLELTVTTVLTGQASG